MREGKANALLLALVLLLFPVSRSYGVNPETLLMPGKVSTAHQKYEEECSRCHDRSNRDRQNQLCLDCHKDIAADIHNSRGFHGKLPGIASSQCRACHSEHLGRDGDIVKLNRDQFDHAATEFPLKGAHAAVTCSACHVADKPYRKTPTACVDCHSKVDPHEGKLGRDCASCHDAASWQQVRFDHDKTGFALHDKHAEVPCLGCHFGNHYKDTPKTCAACHAPDDVHRGERGPKCGECHATTGWKTSKFNHEKETGFALEGVHADIDCRDCHRSGDLKAKIPKDCFGCHQGQDSHAGRLGKDCGSCHGSDKWQQSSFDHARDGHWPLNGRHAKVDCHACHTAPVATQKLSHECNSCHRASDVHSGKLGRQCDQCHSEESWSQIANFDHDLTRFALLGLHVAVPCEQCHVSRNYREVAKECFACHERSDVHKGALGKECAKCHSPNGWGIWEFDHGKETGFALSGAHRTLSCNGCHKQPADQVKLSADCIACHGNDDVHLGQYGRQCQRCHSTSTFKGARLQ
ncbi:MAG: hypothetical protein JOY91_06535 [Sinobacteraceae bacterium]|nr:hypothetical protein [Nevskiaceae bacterium]